MDVEEKVVKDIEALVQQENIAELVKDNVITFEHAGIKYRVTKPTFDQKLEANKRKAAEHIRMLKDSNYLLEKDWIELYKSRGIDVKELDRKFDVLAKKKTEYQLKLGEAIETKAPEEDCEVYRKEISAIISEQLDITGEKSKQQNKWQIRHGIRLMKRIQSRLLLSLVVLVHHVNSLSSFQQ
jgi:hypothetical protein